MGLVDFKSSSPCINKCTPNADPCKGCGRSAEEIREWGTYSDDKKRLITWRIENERGRNNKESHD